MPARDLLKPEKLFELLASKDWFKLSPERCYALKKFIIEYQWVIDIIIDEHNQSSDDKYSKLFLRDASNSVQGSELNWPKSEIVLRVKTNNDVLFGPTLKIGITVASQKDFFQQSYIGFRVYSGFYEVGSFSFMSRQGFGVVLQYDTEFIPQKMSDLYTYESEGKIVLKNDGVPIDQALKIVKLQQGHCLNDDDNHIYSNFSWTTKQHENGRSFHLIGNFVKHWGFCSITNENSTNFAIRHIKNEFEDYNGILFDFIRYVVNHNKQPVKTDKKLVMSIGLQPNFQIYTGPQFEESVTVGLNQLLQSPNEQGLILLASELMREMIGYQGYDSDDDESIDDLVDLWD